MLSLHRNKPEFYFEEDFSFERVCEEASNQSDKDKGYEAKDDGNAKSKLLLKSAVYISPPEKKAASLFAKNILFKGYEPECPLTKKTFFILNDKHRRNMSFNIEACKENLIKALNEHKEALLFRDPFITLEQLQMMHEKEIESVPISLSIPEIASKIGNRKENEDAEFVAPIKCIYSQGLILGVLDGHGGDHVSNFAKQVFVKIFQEQLVKTKGDVRIAFENTFREIQKEIYQNHPEWKSGSVAVICYIDLKTNFLYTATLGDSEAHMYRVFDGVLKSIPLSLVRNLNSKKDALRTIRTGRLILNERPKKHRLLNKSKTHSVNVSRAIGDVDYYYDGNGVIQKPKVTRIKIQKGDLITLKCDGVVDSLHESDVLCVIEKSLENGLNIADSLVKEALDSSQYTNDNVSVVAIQVI